VPILQEIAHSSALLRQKLHMNCMQAKRTIIPIDGIESVLKADLPQYVGALKLHAGVRF
jgi:hypothetical protein